MFLKVFMIFTGPECKSGLEVFFDDEKTQSQASQNRNELST